MFLSIKQMSPLDGSPKSVVSGQEPALQYSCITRTKFTG